ncbi:hypothetical protein GWI33_000274 [Rhynchophorus ferrugineus]|uniref:Uncharacterized protein n=1 Tax=Rhynchophorus ferrugineus TaxID=354439 RepID=A0A834IYN1_RHYFE|nr:hypothetical protein GWI33_000274 [Rhynchophorus ferrugineus]
MVALLTLDIKIAFNPPWSGIVRELRRMNVSGYLVDIVQSYISSRYVAAEAVGRIRTWSGVLHGSVPTLWNVLCNQVLRIDYADNLPIVVRAARKAALEFRLDLAADAVSEKCRNKGSPWRHKRPRHLVGQGYEDDHAYPKIAGQDRRIQKENAGNHAPVDNFIRGANLDSWSEIQTPRLSDNPRLGFGNTKGLTGKDPRKTGVSIEMAGSMLRIQRMGEKVIPEKDRQGADGRLLIMRGSRHTLTYSVCVPGMDPAKKGD